MTPDRRAFLRMTGAAVFGPTLGAAAARSIGPVTRPTPWPGYGEALVVDGLASPGQFNVREGDGSLGSRSLAAARESGVTAVNLTVGVVGEMPDPFESTVADIARWEGVLDAKAALFRRIRTVADLLAAKAQGQVGIIYGFQDTVMLDADLGRMDTFHGLGVRIVQLTYNGRNRVGDGCLEPGNAGLSRFGYEVVEHLNHLGVLVDLSHCSVRTTAEGIQASSGPVGITHTGCRAVFSHPRNKRDEELRACAEGGGVVGIYLMPYLNASGPPSEDDVVRHLDHALNICGEDHVGIGSDNSLTPIDDTPEYYAAVEREVARRKELGISAPREDTAPFVPDLNTPRRLERIADLMATRGHGDRVIEKVIGANFVRLFSEVWT